MFFLGILVTGTLLQLYVFQRATSASFLTRQLFRNLFIAAGVILWTCLVMARTVGVNIASPLFYGVDLVGMDWLGVLLLLSVSFLAVDVCTGFGFFLRPMLPGLRTAALITGTALSVIAIVQGMRPPVIHRYDIHLPGLPRPMDGTVIVAVSDLHLGVLIGTGWLSARVAQILNQHPDMVVLLGDTFDGNTYPRGDLLAVFKRITAPLGVWAVPGNHDMYGDWERNRALLTKAGVNVLDDRWAKVCPGFVIAGVEDLTIASRLNRDKEAIPKALSGHPPETTVLLSHTPWHAKAAADAGVSLMLSAHTHGGQIWPFGYLVRLRYPMIEGLYKAGHMPVIVCRGTGTWGPRMRLWQRGEILRITLHSQ